MLAEETYEAVRVVRRRGWNWLGQCGDWVLKFLRPHDAFAGEAAASRIRQLRLRAAESHRHAELNPLWFDERANCIVSQFVDGRMAATHEANALLTGLIASGRGYIRDVTPKNLRIGIAAALLTDFEINEQHEDWIGNCPVTPME